MVIKKRSSVTAALLLGPLLLAGLAGCGSSSGDAGAQPGGEQGQPFDSFEDYQLAFTACMRDRGIDIADPNSGGMQLTQADEAFTTAAEACMDTIGSPPARDGGEGNAASAEELRAEHLVIAECLREHGVDVPDPGPGEDLVVPADVPTDAFESCAPNGVMGATTGGNP